jgi:hypothetical protein
MTTTTATLTPHPQVTDEVLATLLAQWKADWVHEALYGTEHQS